MKRGPLNSLLTSYQACGLVNHSPADPFSGYWKRQERWGGGSNPLFMITNCILSPMVLPSIVGSLTLSLGLESSSALSCMQAKDTAGCNRYGPSCN